MPGDPSPKAEIERRRLRVRVLLMLRLRSDQIIKTLNEEGFRTSTPTLDRDLAAIRKEDLKRLYQLGESEFISEYQTIGASIREEIRSLKAICRIRTRRHTTG